MAEITKKVEAMYSDGYHIGDWEQIGKEWEELKEKYGFASSDVTEIFTILAQLEYKSKKLKDIPAVANALLAGGWTSADRDGLISEYDLLEEDADKVVEEMAKLEEIYK